MIPSLEATEDLAARLETHANVNKKTWWEGYLKHEIEFLGVPMALIRREVRNWASDSDFTPAQLRRTSLALLRRPIAEEKLAGILIMQELLLPAGELSPNRDLPMIASLFDDGHIWEWNTTDWLCIRVLGPMVAEGKRTVAERISMWVDAPVLWRRRAAAVAFVPVAGQGDALFVGATDMMLSICDALASDQARFAQTSVGWVLRDLSDAESGRVFRFLIETQHKLSREAVRMGAARLSDNQREQLGITGRRRRR